MVKYHVAVALLPERDLDAKGSIKWVREGAENIGPGSRKLIRSLNF